MVFLLKCYANSFKKATYEIQDQKYVFVLTKQQSCSREITTIGEFQTPGTCCEIWTFCW